MSKANREVKRLGKYPAKWDPKPAFGPANSKARTSKPVENRRSK